MTRNTEIPAGYKSSELGVIPEEWQVKRLGELGEVVSGLTYSPDDIRDNGILVLRSSNIQNGQLCFDDNVYVEIESYNPVLEDDILICVRNGSRNLIGKNTLITKQIAGTAFGAFMSVFRSPHNKYLFQLFDTDYFYKSVHQNLGATINSINGSDLKDFRFPIPLIHEQERIAEILGTWDRAIELQGRKVALLQSRKRALMQQLLTPHRRLPNFSEPWKTTKLGEICEITMGQSPDSEYYNSYNQGLPLIQGNTDISNRQTNGRIWTSSITKVCDKGDIVMTVRAPVGAISIATFKSCIGRGVCAMKVTKSNKAFIYHWLIYHELFWLKYEQGSTFSAINSSDVKNLTINIPSLGEQRAIAEVLTTADREIELATQNLTALRSQKRALMQQLLTGKKQVKI